jgi:phenylalanyl-tRNA synthetase alpha chain
MKKELEQLRDDVLAAMSDAVDATGLAGLRVEYLGRKGKIPQLLKGLPDLADDAKKEVGAFANEVKKSLETAFSEAESIFSAANEAGKIEEERIDISVPGTVPDSGHLHLMTQAIGEIKDIFSSVGFVQVRHPEADWDYYAFEALNMPADHPARDEWETFFLADGDKVATGKKGKVILTPHTSNGQVREMEKGNFPIRMMNINKCYRRQSDVTHSPMFYQFEGLMIDKDVSIAQVRGVFDFFVKRFYGPDRETRLRPFHFRFVEPGFELDISCDICKGTAKVDGVTCRLCKEGWLELGGAGMTHPNVIKAGGLDPDVYTGFAFGWGVERCMMMKGGISIDDIRLLYKNDLRFLEQF